MRRVSRVVLYLSLFLIAVSGSAWPQNPAGPGAGTVHYHFGDDPDGAKGWAKANLDDSSWPLAEKKRWPRPAFYSDGFVWVRIMVPVRSDTAEPLALRVGSLTHVLIADQVFVNGMHLGSFGSLPPSPYVEGLPRNTIFDLPPGLARPGTAAHVALRIWYPPFARRAGEFDSAPLTFDQSRTLHAEEVVAGQRALLGHILPITRSRAVYKPASEVGGDFFQIFPTATGGVLIVIGDVSGKGMPAAMTVSLLVGTVRTLAHYTQSPSEILAAMNQRMLARSNGGFTTCLVVRVDANGTAAIANAGHLAPYINGHELPMENGLPLGITGASSYPESEVSLISGARVTLITDGVVEAQNNGGELFGFERAVAISTGTAEEIARAAQAFGQEDDVTVVTLTRRPILDQVPTQLQIQALSPPLA